MRICRNCNFHTHDNEITVCPDCFNNTEYVSGKEAQNIRAGKKPVDGNELVAGILLAKSTDGYMRPNKFAKVMIAVIITLTVLLSVGYIIKGISTGQPHCLWFMAIALVVNISVSITLGAPEFSGELMKYSRDWRRYARDREPDQYDIGRLGISALATAIITNIIGICLLFAV